MEQEIFSLIGKLIIYGGGAIALAYGLFRFLGEKWIENKFAEKLQAYKHKQQKELENTKYTINSKVRGSSLEKSVILEQLISKRNT